MSTLVEAIARQEGFYVNGTRSRKNNNPGDIEAGRFASAHGAVGSDGRFAKFPDPGTGFNAMRALLKSAYLGITIAEALNKWAPPQENQTNDYIAAVCEMTGMSPETILSEDNLG